MGGSTTVTRRGGGSDGGPGATEGSMGALAYEHWHKGCHEFDMPHAQSTRNAES